MEIMIKIPDEQIEKSLAESKYIHENEGEKGSVNIVLLYTNKKLEFVDISRKTDFYSLTDKYTVLPKGHGRIMDVDKVIKKMEEREEQLKDDRSIWETAGVETALDMFGETIIEAEESESE